MHIKNFKKIGIKISENTSFIECKCDRIESEVIDLDFPSVGATENLVLASVLGNSEVIINNAAMEPEIVDLACFLNKMGARVYGAGTNTIRVKGVKSLKDVSYKVMPDRIEAGTLLVAGAITRGKIKLNNVNPEHISPLLHKLVECGCKIVEDKNTVSLEVHSNLNGAEIRTMPYPGFPTDLQPIITSFLTTCKGTSIITENIFENRFKYMQEMKRMGVKFNLEGKTLIVKGIKRPHGANVVATDLRGGAALVLEALYARGITEVREIEHILRGYDGLEKKLNKLGANIVYKNLN